MPTLQRAVAAWLAAFVVMFALAGLFNTVIIVDFVQANIPAGLLRNPPDMALIAGGYLLLALLMTIIYPRVVRQSSFFLLPGLVFGAAAGIGWQLPYAMVLHGAYVFPVEALFIDTGWALVEQGAGGVAIGAVYGWRTR